MPEEKIYIKNDSLIIEALLDKASGEEGVVICHPHPQMGGSMNNNVVDALQQAYAAANYSTLKFNFRGVGGSTGAYDDGIGEQEDIFAVRTYMEKLGLTKLYLAGYSFGAWVGAKILEESRNHFAGSVCVSPPINLLSFNWDSLINKIDLIICGDLDQFCPVDVLIQQAQLINAPVEIIRGADHFYQGKEKELTRTLIKHIAQ